MVYLISSGEALSIARCGVSSARPRAARANVAMRADAPRSVGRVAAIGGLASVLAAARPASAANSSPWGLSEFMKKVDADEVEKVIFSESGKELLALDSDGDRHAVEILPAESPWGGEVSPNVQPTVE